MLRDRRSACLVTVMAFVRPLQALKSSQAVTSICRRSISAAPTLDVTIYKSSAKSSGRTGRAWSLPDSGGRHGELNVKLEKHPDHGIPGGKGGATNPEELLAAGYAACFNDSLQFIAYANKIECGDSDTTVTVAFGVTDTGVGLGVTIDVSVEGVNDTVADDLATKAHSFCPFSKAIAGNISVEVRATGRGAQ